MAEKKYKEIKLDKGQAQGLYDLWNSGMEEPKKKATGSKKSDTKAPVKAAGKAPAKTASKSSAKSPAKTAGKTKTSKK